MAYYRCGGGSNPTGNAVESDVLLNKTFSNEDGTDKVGSMPNNGAVSTTLNTSTTSYTVPEGYHNGSGTVSITTQTKSASPSTSAQTISPDSGKLLSSVTISAISTQEKTVTSSRSAQTVTPDSGKYLTKVTVNALAPTGTYTASSRGASLDMGATSNYRYVNTNSVPNTNSGTYTYASGSTGGTVDMGATNSYRYVNADNVYSKGAADGATDPNARVLLNGNHAETGFSLTGMSTQISNVSGACYVKITGYDLPNYNSRYLQFAGKTTSSSGYYRWYVSSPIDFSKYKYISIGVYFSSGTNYGNAVLLNIISNNTSSPTVLKRLDVKYTSSWFWDISSVTATGRLSYGMDSSYSFIVSDIVLYKEQLPTTLV